MVSSSSTRLTLAPPTAQEKKLTPYEVEDVTPSIARVIRERGSSCDARGCWVTRETDGGARRRMALAHYAPCQCTGTVSLDGEDATADTRPLRDGAIAGTQRAVLHHMGDDRLCAVDLRAETKAHTRTEPR